MKKNIKRKLFEVICACTVITALSVSTVGAASINSNKPAGIMIDKNSSTKASLVLFNGSIYTMDGERSQAEAIAIRDDKIIYVGNNEGVKSYISSATEVINLNGRMVLPGFVDGHIHSASGWVTDMYQCNLASIEPTEEAYLKELKRFANENPDLDVIIGKSFQVNVFGDLGPTKEALDKIDSKRPIIITDTSQHSIWANSKAIEMAGITPSTKDPEGGKIYHNSDGSVRGYFADVFSFNAVEDLGAITLEQYKDAWLNWQQEANSYGITSINDAGYLDGTTMTKTDRYKMVSDMEDEGSLSLRVNLSYSPTVNDASEAAISQMFKDLEDSKQYESDYQVIRTVKIFLDGVVEGRTGLLLEPYDVKANTKAGYKGVPIWTKENLNKFVEAVDKKGYSMHMHTIADGSTRMGIDAVERAKRINGETGSRHVQTHITIMNKDDMPRMAENGIIAAMQPVWFYRDPLFSQLEEQMLGTERFNQMYAIKDMLDAGIIMTGSADYSVVPDYRPLAGIETGATQCSPYHGEDTDTAFVRNADQAASLMQMLEAYTINGAYQMGMEDKIGSLEVGKLADLVVLENNLFDIELKDIAETNIDYTIIGGRTVYDSSKITE